MAKIVFETGQTVEFDGTPSPQDIEEVANQLKISAQPKSKMAAALDAIVPKDTSGLFGTSVGKDMPVIQNARRIQQIIRAGGKLMSDSVDPQSQSVVSNVIQRLPGTVADIGANLLADTVSPENIVTSGVLKAAKIAAPAVRAFGRNLGQGMEEVSGLGYKNKGVLAREFNRPGLMFGPGLDKARAGYEAAKGGIEQLPKQFPEMMDKKEFVQKALDAIKAGTSNPITSLEARKTLDSIKRTMPNKTYHEIRDVLDHEAKKLFMGADAAYKQALDSEALRTFMPRNKTGSPSIVKGALIQLLPKLAGFMSPVAQGTIAGTLGLAAKAVRPFIQNPVTSGIGASQVYNALKSIFRPEE